MIADGDLPELDPNDDPDSVEAEPGVPAPRAVVVVERGAGRQLGILLPAAVVLMIAVAIISVRVRVSDWRGLVVIEAPPAPPAAPKPPESPDSKQESARAVPEPRTGEPLPSENQGLFEIARAEPNSSATHPTVEVTVSNLDPEPEAEPEAEAAPIPERTEPEAIVENAAPTPVEEAIDPDVFWEEIRQEARRIHADREQLQDLKPAAFEHDVMVAEARRGDAEAERRQLQATLREEFLQSVREVLRRADPDQADALRRLMKRREGGLDAVAGNEWRQRADALSRSRAGRADWVAELRQRGVAEAAILEELARTHIYNAASRHGPRDADDALILAARELVAFAAAAPPAPLANGPARLPKPAQPVFGPLPANGDGQSSRFGSSNRRR